MLLRNSKRKSKLLNPHCTITFELEPPRKVKVIFSAIVDLYIVVGYPIREVVGGQGVCCSSGPSCFAWLLLFQFSVPDVLIK